MAVQESEDNYLGLDQQISLRLHSSVTSLLLVDIIKSREYHTGELQSPRVISASRA